MEKKVNWNITYLRILATLGVVFFHTNAAISAHPEWFSVSNCQSLFCLFGKECMLWAVPVFFMITGYLLLGSEKELSYTIVLKKYVLRIFLALTIFSLPFAVLKIYGETHSLSVVSVIKAYIGNESMEHLWYLYPLIGLYLVSPVLKPSLKKISDSTIVFFLSVVFFFVLLLPMISNVLNVKIAFDVPLKYHLFYFVAGYCCRILIEKGKVNVKIAAIVMIASLIPIALFVFSNQSKFLEYSNPFVALMSVSIFLLVMSLPYTVKNSRLQSVLWKVDRLCFTVYLIHPVFVQIAYRKMRINPIDCEVWPLAIVGCFLCFSLLSFLASWFIVKIPVLKKVLL